MGSKKDQRKDSNNTVYLQILLDFEPQSTEQKLSFGGTGGSEESAYLPLRNEGKTGVPG